MRRPSVRAEAGPVRRADRARDGSAVRGADDFCVALDIPLDVTLLWIPELRVSGGGIDATLLVLDGVIRAYCRRRGWSDLIFVGLE